MPSAEEARVIPVAGCLIAGRSSFTQVRDGSPHPTLDGAISTLKPGVQLVIPSEGGILYRWPGWLDHINASRLIRSMSRKGCSSDNAACEGFFGRIKNEMYYGRNWVGATLENFMCLLDRYIRWYNEERIKISLGAMSPVKYRQHLRITT